MHQRLEPSRSHRRENVNEEFEKWAKGEGFDLTLGKHSGTYMNPETFVANAAWQASRKQALEDAASLCDNFEEAVLKPQGKYDTMDVDCYPETAAACATAIRAMQKD